ncbi:thioredoxin family protein [Tengunoibacter tsumagoiensis]|nr:thioredoxin family protein [Tengunoibacter tsumagoiensis]
MSDLLVRLVVLLSMVALTLIIVWVARRLVESRRQPLHAILPDEENYLPNEGRQERDFFLPSRVRILAFQSEDSPECRQLQAPVLRWIVEARGEVVSVINIDASNCPELTDRYQVMTVPTTVLLDMKGKAHAVNYGFTNAQSLLKQVDEILALDEYASIV